MDTPTTKQNPELRAANISETNPSWPPREVERTREVAPAEGESGQPASPPLSRREDNAAAPPAAVVVAPSKSALDIEIEEILSEDLDNLFWGLSAADQATFKVKGEETASRIRWLLSEATIKIQDILKLITDWLKTLPGVNSIFVEQEAKNKTDKILKLRG